jgi:hypothetical protein
LEDSKALDGTKAMLLSWFGEDELEVCPRCHRNEVLPSWGSATGRVCLTCGLLSPREAAGPPGRTILATLGQSK